MNLIQQRCVAVSGRLLLVEHDRACGAASNKELEARATEAAARVTALESA